VSELSEYVTANWPAVKAMLRERRFAPIRAACFSRASTLAFVNAAGWQTIAEADASVAAMCGAMSPAELDALHAMNDAGPAFQAADDGMWARDWIWLSKTILDTINGDPALPVKTLPFNPAAGVYDLAVVQSDGFYLVPTEAQLRHLAAICPAGWADYKAEANDCDNQARQAAGWMSRHGVGDLSIGVCGYRAFLADGRVRGHALMLAVTCEAIGGPARLWWWDPLSRRVEPLTVLTLGGFADVSRLEITALLF
jgi:hypothetical protein